MGSTQSTTVVTIRITFNLDVESGDTYGVAGDEGFRKHQELDVVFRRLLDEPNSFLDSGRLVHKNRCSVSRSHLELGFFRRHVVGI